MDILCIVKDSTHSAPARETGSGQGVNSHSPEFQSAQRESGLWMINKMSFTDRELWGIMAPLAMDGNM
ncbi:hypothetical protein V1264_005870 [Littorina saxatilis]|uniref:Uncharacterized protein n=1 Tax=Littorina saxatilis TaxID=31220 RepID=A0AAN9B028_9CAEN